MNQALMEKGYWKWVQAHRSPWIEMIQLQEDTMRPWEMTDTTSYQKATATLEAFMQLSVLYTMGQGTRIRFWIDNQLQQQPIKSGYP